jgi:hypothetical protein
VNIIHPARLLRNLSYPLKRWRTLLAWRRWNFTDVPVVIGNAMPKSGSKLLMQILHGFTRIAPLVDPGFGPIRTVTVNGRTRLPEEIQADLRRLQPGNITLSYLHATPENQAFLNRPNWASFFIYRDPRDLLVSHVFYATDLNPNHAMHAYYQGISMDERLNTAITGIQRDGLSLPSVRTRYERILGWLEVPCVMSLRFESLILEREKTIQAMLHHFEAAGYTLTIPHAEAERRLAAAIDPKKSPTFRKGKVGNWQEYFTPHHKRLFKEVAGDLLVRLGYEQDNDW